MKKTVKINLSGLVFTLDEDAYQALKNYLDSINSKFRDTEEGDEIIADIESRIAEIFQSQTRGKKQVITLEDVNEVIRIMGKPEDFAEGEEYPGETVNGNGQQYRKRNRRLYRDQENAILGGVASGLAAYFGIEAWIVRLLLVILTFPIQVIPIIYIILWIVLPKAETAAQKLEMRGEKVTISNIEKTVKDEYEGVKENVKRVKETKEYKKTKNVMGEIFHVIGQILLVFLKIILFIIGIGFIIGGLTALMSLTGVFFFRDVLFPVEIWGGQIFSFHDFFDFFVHPPNLTLFTVALFLTVVIPIVALIYAGIKMIFRFKANDRAIGLTGLVLWLLSVIFLVTLVAYEGRSLANFGKSSDTDHLNSFTSDTLFITMYADPSIEGFQDEWFYDEDEDWHIISEQDKIYGKINLDIELSFNNRFEVVTTKKSQGESRLAAAWNADMLDYSYIQEDSLLLLSPYFSLSKNLKWRLPSTEILVRVPEGKYVHLDKNTQYFLEGVDNVDDLWSRRLAGKTWVMTSEGLDGI